MFTNLLVPTTVDMDAKTAGGTVRGVAWVHFIMARSHTHVSLRRTVLNFEYSPMPCMHERDQR